MRSSKLIRTFSVSMALIVALVTVLLPATALAGEYTAARKAGRGLAAMTTGFLEVPGNIVKTTRERGAGWGWSLGFVTGLGMIVVRELVGVFELVTSPFDVPEGYEPIIDPEFPWDYFDEPTPKSR